MLSAQQVAEYFIWKAQVDGKPITNKKLQKLIYYAQAWFVALKKEKLFDEKIEAWIHGPAVREIYLEYKRFGFEPITKKIDGGTFNSISSDKIEHMENVWNVYGAYDGQYLEYLTHSEDPWKKARVGIEAHIGTDKEISIKDMFDFYSKLKLSADNVRHR
ncbi:MAG: hypothetical protein A3A31_02945 [Candidatus Zambryskibacteria bacterium RIFCSPLOWO2_01_FULL_48_25]|uniref:Antitoxin SocA-like Panacea domain-containing protein n=1 Tax=Candidatus Zambryskibacteria bacterium RIFCSPHIGHO2_01_FULL_46_25 TaxID=1802738 RepID=A0A1G2SYU0_9BACT|nr:MAG: hypothetical protein A2838_00310 [Candidatus Zambryskibacteria bacterium RIFCSPHIGHO2_01_FULL_46_25]OHB06615.1 MAG: hypothetical protein A3A31_02945 [Candidatus Zambryskibacteria bacterium RIFCSPLOWO2_01_FULL_48_25]